MTNSSNKQLQWSAPFYYNSKLKLFLWILPFLISIIIFSIYNNEFDKYFDTPENINPLYFNYTTTYTIIIVIYYVILKYFYKKEDPEGKFGQIFLRKKYDAIYTIKENKIIIEFNNKKIIYPFKKINFFTNVAPESVKHYTDGQFSSIYLIKSRKLYYKYITILIPKKELDIIFNEIEKNVKFYDKNEIGKKVTPLYIKIILILAFLLLFFVLSLGV